MEQLELGSVWAGVQRMLHCGRLGCQLELVLASGLGCAGAALEDWLECLYRVFVWAIKGEGTKKWCSLVPLTLERVLAVPCPFGIYSRVSECVSFMYSLYALYTAVSSLCPKVGES